jgi:hypothetical protein
MGEDDTGDDRNWFQRNQERSHTQISNSGRAKKSPNINRRPR